MNIKFKRIVGRTDRHGDFKISFEVTVDGRFFGHLAVHENVHTKETTMIITPQPDINNKIISHMPWINLDVTMYHSKELIESFIEDK